MASKKSFKPPVKTVEEKTELARQRLPLTDDRYEEIFKAVLQSSQERVAVKSPTATADLPDCKAHSPKETASVENSQSSVKEKKKINHNLEKNPDSSSLSILSDDFSKNAVFSTPDKIKYPKTYLQSLKSLQQKAKLNDSFSETESMNSTIRDLLDDIPLSQPPKHLRRREKLLWLQNRRGTPVHVKCDLCEKWRQLDIVDPVDVPRRWFCSMNADKTMASCAVPEKPIPRYVDCDMILNCYTAGSLVWAKVPGYPWWPAMVDDCPDTEQYYWISEIFKAPDWYHVVFFDSTEVTRNWFLLKDLKSFKHNPELDKQFIVKSIYKKRMSIAKEKANIALGLDIKERLKRYSFISLWKQELPEYDDSSTDDSDIENSQDFNKYVKYKTSKLRKQHEIRANGCKKNEKLPNIPTLIEKTHSKSKNKSEKTKKTVTTSKPLNKIQKKSSKNKKVVTTPVISPTDIEKLYSQCREKFEKGKLSPKELNTMLKKVQDEQTASTSMEFQDDDDIEIPINEDKNSSRKSSGKFEYEGKRRKSQSSDKIRSKKPSRNFECVGKRQNSQSSDKIRSRNPSRDFEYEGKRQNSQSLGKIRSRNPSGDFEYEGKRQNSQSLDKIRSRNPSGDFECEGKRQNSQSSDKIRPRKSSGNFECEGKQQNSQSSDKIRSRKPSGNFECEGKRQNSQSPDKIRSRKPSGNFECEGKRQNSQSSDKIRPRKSSGNFECEGKRQNSQSSDKIRPRKSSGNFECEGKQQHSQSSDKIRSRKPSGNFECEGKRQNSQSSDKIRPRKSSGNFECEGKRQNSQSSDKIRSRKSSGNFEYEGKRRNSQSSNKNRSRKSSKTSDDNEEKGKRPRLMTKIKQSKMEIKVKKSFVAPKKKNSDDSFDTDLSTTNFPEKIFDDND